jgi:hypothetical protein
MTKEEILNGMSEEEFYNLYPTEEAYFMAKGGSLSGAPHNGQPTADEFFSYGAPALGHMNIPMSNPTYLAHGGTYFGGPTRPYAYGGGLPGGANDMPCMNCGGYMNMGGYNSPTNYGSFSVPMAEGGEGDELTPEQKREMAKWAATEQAKLIARTKKDLPEDLKLVKKEDARWTEPFRPSGDIYQGSLGRPGSEVVVDKDKNRFDSLHVSPVDPNLALFFKGKNKVIVGPRYNTQEARNLAKDFNKEYFYEKDEELFPNYAVNTSEKEYGGILDASNNQDYPMMDEGGRSNLMKIIKAAGKKMKKEYAAGGHTVLQGGNQDYLTQRNGTYDNFLKQNVYNSLVDQEQQDISKAFMRMGGLPKAQSGFINPVDMTMNAMRSYNPKQPDYLPQKSAIDMFAKQTDADLQERLNSAEIKTPTVEPSNWEERLSNSLQTIGRQAIPIANKWAERLENKPSEMAKQKDIMNRLITPGSDLSAFQAKPANAMNKGDYDPNSGMFRPNQMVPVQFPGGMYNDYGRAMAFGGTYEEGEEYELSQEEIDELRNQGYELEELD